MHRVLFVLTLLALLCCPFHVGGQDQKDKQKKEDNPALDELMKKKLKNAQLILEGIAIADSKKTVSGANELVEIANSTTWPLILSPQYDQHNADFIRSAKKLAKTADEKNMEAAALAYVEMTLTCVRCHQFVREQKRERLSIWRPPRHCVAEKRRGAPFVERRGQGLKCPILACPAGMVHALRTRHS